MATVKLVMPAPTEAMGPAGSRLVETGLFTQMMRLATTETPKKAIIARRIAWRLPGFAATGLRREMRPVMMETPKRTIIVQQTV